MKTLLATTAAAALFGAQAMANSATSTKVNTFETETDAAVTYEQKAATGTGGVIADVDSDSADYEDKVATSTGGTLEGAPGPFYSVMDADGNVVAEISAADWDAYTANSVDYKAKSATGTGGVIADVDSGSVDYQAKSATGTGGVIADTDDDGARLAASSDEDAGDASDLEKDGVSQ